MSAHDDEPFFTLLTSVANQQRDALAETLRRRGFDGIGLPGFRLVAELERGERSVQGLAAATGTTKQFCAREVHRLAEEGYLTLQSSEDDRRVTLISPSERGRRFMAAVREVKHELDSAIVKRLGASDARRFRRMLTILKQ
jgi:DNA-binding MarR family transcriptional regulator